MWFITVLFLDLDLGYSEKKKGFGHSASVSRHRDEAMPYLALIKAIDMRYEPMRFVGITF